MIEVAEAGENTLKFVLGLALVNRHDDLFDEVVTALGSKIYPFKNDFMQARRNYSKAVRCLCELVLKAMIVSCEGEQVKLVLSFATIHNYLLTVDEQSVMQALLCTYPDKELAGDYSLIRLLITGEVAYAIRVTDVNR